MSLRPSVHDAIVVGGGPAGATAARLLAQWGRDVLLVTAGPSRGPALAESLPPSVRKLTDTVGITDAIEGAGFLAARGNTFWWGDDDGRVVDFPDGTGWQVDRSRFDARLLELAEKAGCRVVRRAPVESALREGGSSEVRFRNHRPGAPPRVRARARFLLDCSGRAGVLARCLRISREDGPPTTALIGVWEKAGGWDLPDPSHTLVEGYRDGWAWSIPVDRETRYVTAMVDPGTSEVSPGGDLEAMYRGELEKTKQLGGLLEGASPVAGPWGCGATPYAASRFTGPGLLLVGDAASFIDPLSSYGVKKALASAWLAAVVVNTLLERPELSEVAKDYFETREREAFRQHASRAADFYDEGAAFHAHPFWTRRCRDHAPDGSGDEAFVETGWTGKTRVGGESPDVTSLARDPRILAAFEGLRRAPEVRLRLTGPTKLVQGPVVRGRTLVLEDRLVTSGFPRGIRYLRNVDLLRLTRSTATLGPRRADVPGLYRRYRERVGPVLLPDFLGAISVLLAEGVLENEAADHPIPEIPGSPSERRGASVR